MGRKRLTEQEKFVRLCAKGSGKKVEEAILAGANLSKMAFLDKDENYESLVTPLEAAVKAENRRTLKVLIKYVDYVEFFFMSISLKRIEDCKILLECGADINKTDNEGHNAVWFAIDQNDSKALEWLLYNGADTWMMYDEGYSPLMFAVKKHSERSVINFDYNILKYLIWSEPPFINSMALMFCVKTLNYTLIEQFLKYGVDINFKVDSASPLMVALDGLKRDDNNYRYMISFLLENGADPNEKIYFNDGTMITVLSYVVSIEDTDVARTLLMSGADPNVKDSKGRAPLIYSILTSSKMSEVLLQYGADPDTTDDDGRTPLMFAVIDINTEEGVIETLLENNADINRQDKYGLTALMWAINRHDRAPKFVFKALIRTGGFNVEGWLLWCTFMFFYMLAEHENQIENVRLLLQNNADISITDKKGMTAVSYAAAHSNDDVLELLMQYDMMNNKMNTEMNNFI